MSLRKLRAERGRDLLAMCSITLGLVLAAGSCSSSSGSGSEESIPGDSAATSTLAPPVSGTATNPDGDPELDPSALRVAVFGDSTALSTGLGLGDWMNGKGNGPFSPLDGGAYGVVSVNGYTMMGCGILGSGVLFSRGAEVERGPECDTWLDSWSSALDLELATNRVAVVQVGVWETTDWKIPGTSEFHHVGTPEFDEKLKTSVEAALDAFADKGIAVLWVLTPHIEVGTEDGVRPEPSFPESDPARVDRFNEIVTEVVESHPGPVGVLDLPGLLEEVAPGGEMDSTLRPDLTHFNVDAFQESLAGPFGELIMARYSEITGWQRPGCPPDWTPPPCAG